MDSVLRGLAIYVVLLMLFRVTGKRSLAQITTFDFVVLLIIAEALEQAMIGPDNSMTNAFLIITTLLMTSLGMSILKERHPRLERLIDNEPMILVDNGRVLRERLRMARVGVDDLLQAAREQHGSGRLDQIKYAVLERDGKISIIPAERR